jgi:hypothetical protein
VVVFHSDIEDDPRSMATEMIHTFKVKEPTSATVLYAYGSALKGVTISNVSSRLLKEIMNDPYVKYVEEVRTGSREDREGTSLETMQM